MLIWNRKFSFPIEGKRYEVLLTTYDGLYRYQTEDIIKVTGRYYALPVWQLIGRFVRLKSIVLSFPSTLDVVSIYPSLKNMLLKSNYVRYSIRFSLLTNRNLLPPRHNIQFSQRNHRTFFRWKWMKINRRIKND